MIAHLQSSETQKLSKADFVSNQNVRWCPGCGDYSILANVQKVMPELGVPREKIVFISGIGCSSRFPYYMNTYGFHTIHGRAPAVASGLKIARPDLSIWVVTGDGDGLSIGGNHLIHILRRNTDVNILLLNNRIYGLTKGQYSPTSERGKKTKSTPYGSIIPPMEPLRMALGAGTTFVARMLDIDPQGLQKALKEAHAHKGTSFIEIFQNCNIFNDGAFGHISERALREEHILTLEHGKPLIFGKNKDKGIRLNHFVPEVVSLGNGITESDLVVHDVTNSVIAEMLCQLDYPNFPVPMGVFYQVQRDTYEDSLAALVENQVTQKGPGDLRQLLYSGQVWEIGATQVGQGIEEDKFSLEEIDIFPEVPREHRKLMEEPISALNPPLALIVSAEDSVAHAIELMQEKNYGSVHVFEDDELIGIFTEDDIVNKIIGFELELKSLPVSQMMTPTPLCIELKDTIAFAFNQMVIAGNHHLPVIEDGRPTRVTSARDLLNYIGNHFKM
ncbi:MAG: CBS domain-containing protein [SAR324 cluster bacterium]|nr:CBS domain-containing protein [SAR324 cluster bacterium]